MKFFVPHIKDGSVAGADGERVPVIDHVVELPTLLGSRIPEFIAFETDDELLNIRDLEAHKAAAFNAALKAAEITATKIAEIVAADAAKKEV